MKIMFDDILTVLDTWEIDLDEARTWARRYYRRFNRMESYANMLNDEVIKIRAENKAIVIITAMYDQVHEERDSLRDENDKLSIDLIDSEKQLDAYKSVLGLVLGWSEIKQNKILTKELDELRKESECITVACPRCGLEFTDFVNDALQAKLDVANRAAEYNSDMFDCLKIDYDTLQAKLDIAVEALIYAASSVLFPCNQENQDKVAEIADIALKRLEG